MEDYFPLVAPVRLLIADLDKQNQLFDDEQVIAFLALYKGDTKRAAARALRTIATSEVLISKVITTQDLSTNGAAVAAELRAQAEALEAEALAEAEIQAGSYADYVPFTSGGRHGEEGEEHAYPW